MDESKLILTGDLGSFTTRMDFAFGQRALRKASSEAQFADGMRQFEAKRTDGRWQIVGNPAAVNATTLNGKEVGDDAVILHSGDEIAVRGRSSGKVAMRIWVTVGRGQSPVGGSVSAGQSSVPAGRPLCAGLTEDEREFQELLALGWREFAEEIDVTEFMRKCGWTVSQVKASLYDAKFNNPEIFYLVDRGRCTCSRGRGGQIRRFAISDVAYYFPKKEFAQRKAELDAAVAEAMKSIAGAKSQVEKALGLHDYLVRTCEYDLKAAAEHDGSPLARTVYSVLVRHLAVCEGYAMAYRYLLNAVGIVSEEAHGVGIPHIWNYVRLDGKWYHVDVTWDDPVYSGIKPPETFVSREHFLMSDRKARATGHPDWNVGGLPSADDETYDGRHWPCR